MFLMRQQYLKSHLSSKVTAPATTGDATLVPDKERQPPLFQKVLL